MIGGKKPGFSLFEMLLVVALFMTSAVILSQVFVSYNRLHRKIANLSVVGQDTRFAMELIVRAVRNNQIDYTYEPLDVRREQLSLKTPDGGTIDIARITSDLCLDPLIEYCLGLSLDGGATWQPITAKRINVKNFDVYTLPLSSPFIQSGVSYSSNQQPMTTINLGLEYMANDPKDNARLQTQTTVTSRVYVR